MYTYRILCGDVSKAEQSDRIELKRVNSRVVVRVNGHCQLATTEQEFSQKELWLLDRVNRVTVVPEELACGKLVSVESHDEAERILATERSVVRWFLRWYDVAATHVQVDIVEWRLESSEASCGQLAVVIVVPFALRRKVGIDGAFSVFDHTADEPGWSNQELLVDTATIVVWGKFLKETAHDKIAGNVRSIEERVVVWQNLVTDIERLDGRVDHWLRKHGRILIFGTFDIVITRVRIEGTDLLPSGAQLLVRFTGETANIRANIWT